jgi:hypothetical protein
MEATYEKQFQVEAESGANNFYEIDYPHRGRLSKLMIRQVTGVAEGFEADLYNSARPLQAHEAGSHSSASAAESFNDGNYKILPTQVAAGDASEVFKPEGGYPYRNVDGTYSVPQRKLYLRLEPNGTGTKTFEVALNSLHQQ